MQLLLYVTTSCESKQAHMARWPAYQESVMSGNTYVRKTQVQIHVACSIWFVRLCIEKRANEFMLWYDSTFQQMIRTFVRLFKKNIRYYVCTFVPSLHVTWSPVSYLVLHCLLCWLQINRWNRKHKSRDPLLTKSLRRTGFLEFYEKHLPEAMGLASNKPSQENRLRTKVTTNWIIWVWCHIRVWV